MKTNITYDDRKEKVLRFFTQTSHVDRVLDIGCNDGSISFDIKNVTHAREVWGVDTDLPALKSAVRRGINAVRLDIDLCNLPFDDNFFDAIYCGQVIGHLSNPDHLLEEIYRTLKWGGICVIDTPNLASWHGRIALLFGYQPSYSQVSNKYNVGKLIGGIEFDENAAKPHHWVFTYRALKELVTIHNFKIIKTSGAMDFNVHFPLSIIEKLRSPTPHLSTYSVLITEKSK